MWYDMWTTGYRCNAVVIHDTAAKAYASLCLRQSSRRRGVTQREQWTHRCSIIFWGQAAKNDTHLRAEHCHWKEQKVQERRLFLETVIWKKLKLTLNIYMYIFLDRWKKKKRNKNHKLNAITCKRRISCPGTQCNAQVVFYKKGKTLSIT